VYTTCPECGTVFRIGLAQLRAAEGYVRCGHCAATFNAVLSLTDQAPDTPGLEPATPAPGDSRAPAPLPPVVATVAAPGLDDTPAAAANPAVPRPAPPAAAPTIAEAAILAATVRSTIPGTAAAPMAPPAMAGGEADDDDELAIPEDFGPESWDDTVDIPVRVRDGATHGGDAADHDPDADADADDDGEGGAEADGQTPARDLAGVVEHADWEALLGDMGDDDDAGEPVYVVEEGAAATPAEGGGRPLAGQATNAGPSMDGAEPPPGPALIASRADWPGAAASVAAAFPGGAGDREGPADLEPDLAPYLEPDLEPDLDLDLEPDLDEPVLYGSDLEESELEGPDLPVPPLGSLDDEDDEPGHGHAVTMDADDDTMAAGRTPADYAVAEAPATRQAAGDELPPAWRDGPAWPPGPAESPAGRGWAWGLGSLALALALAAQVVTHQRDQLATHPTWGSLVTRLYGQLGMAVYPAWDLGSFEVRGSEAVAGRASQGALEIVARIAVVGSTPVGLPMVRVSLRDRRGDVLGQRIFAAAEYLPEGTSLVEPLAPGTLIPVQVTLADPGLDASGYEVDVCLMTRQQGLACQAEREPFAPR
jgi:predicted Zn finger-like uncharacterized protein